MEEKEFLELLEESREIIEKKTVELREDAAEKLAEKYHRSFRVIASGNRFDRSSTTLYVIDTDDPDVIFRAEYNEGEIISDSYLPAKLGAVLATELSERCAGKGLCVAANVSFAGHIPDGLTDPEIGLSDYFSQCKVNDVLIYMAVDAFCIRDNAADELVGCLTQIAGKYGVETAVCGFVLSDDYSKCADLITRLPDVSSTTFDDFRFISKFSFAVSDGRVNIETTALKRALCGES